MLKEMKCPNCESKNIKSIGLNLELSKVLYMCEDCEQIGTSDYFINEEI